MIRNTGIALIALSVLALAATITLFCLNLLWQGWILLAGGGLLSGMVVLSVGIEGDYVG